MNDNHSQQADEYGLVRTGVRTFPKGAQEGDVTAAALAPVTYLRETAYGLRNLNVNRSVLPVTERRPTSYLSSSSAR